MVVHYVHTYIRTYVSGAIPFLAHVTHVRKCSSVPLSGGGGATSGGQKAEEVARGSGVLSL